MGDLEPTYLQQNFAPLRPGARIIDAKFRVVRRRPSAVFGAIKFIAAMAVAVCAGAMIPAALMIANAAA